MKAYIRNWGFMRVLRLALGIFVIVQGIVAADWTWIALGGLFSLLPLLNAGCCGAAGCDTPKRKDNGNIENVHYEEVR